MLDHLPNVDGQLRAAVAGAFAPTAAPERRLVGAEIELIASRRMNGDGVRARFVRTGCLSFEPGGQFEFSLAPRPSVPSLVGEAIELVGRVQETVACQGVRLDLVGVDPRRDWDEVPLATTSPRYLAMQRIFDEVGPDGRRMMRLTAALQVCLDLLPGRAGLEQWLVANLAGPALVVHFANCPDVPRSRTAIWRGVDMRRTGYDGRYVDAADPVGAYTAFAAAARRFPIPEAQDPRYHLTTLFPPVRPRGGYLEVRYLDAQPLTRIGEAIDVLVALLYEPHARRTALELLLPRLDRLDTSWADAAAGRCADVEDVLRIAQTGMLRLPPRCLHGSGRAA